LCEGGKLIERGAQIVAPLDARRIKIHGQENSEEKDDVSQSELPE
jgi:hypothetical protein